MQKIKIGDVCDVLNGFAFKSENYVGSGIRVIRIANVQKGYIEDTTPAFYPLDSGGLDKYMLENGDLLMSLTGNVGRVAMLEADMLPAALNQRVACLRLKSSKISKKYLFHILNSDYFEQQCIQSSKGVAQKNMSTEWLKDYEIPLYSPEQQNEIASVLDRVHLIINTQKKQLQKLDELVKARFVELFGDMFLNSKAWEERPLDLLAEVVSGITKGRKAKEPHLTEVPYMAVSNVKDGYIDWTTVKTIQATQQEIEQYRLLPDDVLMTEGGDPDKLGRGAILKEPLENCIHQNHIFRVRLNESLILPTFFAEYLKHQKAKRYFLGCAKQTTGIASINMRQLKALPVLLPPLELQVQFASFVKQVDKSKVAVQKSLDEAQLLFDSLMQQYFG
jgi:type I restriction enzyme S subunit